MKSILFPVAMLVGVACSTVPHPAHAQDATMMQMDLWDMQDSLDDIQDRLAGRNAPTYRYRAPRKEWHDVLGGRHDCQNDPPTPILGPLLGARC